VGSLCSPLLASSAASAPEAPSQQFRWSPQRKVLYSPTRPAFQHGVLPLSENILREIGAASRAFELAVARDSNEVNRENLRNYDAIVFYTSGELPPVR
jgi:hypothetical protein